MNPDPQIPNQDPNAPLTPVATDPLVTPMAEVTPQTNGTTVDTSTAAENPVVSTPIVSEQPIAVSPAPADPMANGQPPVVMAVAPQENHSDTLGILSIVFAFLSPLIGLILAIIGRSKAKKEGRVSKLSKIGLILSIVFLVINTIVITLYLILVVLAVSSTETAKNAQIDVTSDINSTYAKVEEYYNDNGSYPTAIDPSFTSFNDTLTADSFNVVVVDTDAEARAETTSNTDSQPYTYVVFGCTDIGCKGYYIAHNSEDGTLVAVKTGLSNGL